MTGTELAIKLGFIVSKDGRVFLNDKEYTSSMYNKRALSFTFRNNGKKFQAYTGKIQAYQKFGNKALSDTTYYLDGNSANVSYDNISLLSIEQERARNRSTKICSKCGKEYPIECFVFKDKKNNKRSPRCIECDRLGKRESYHKHYEDNKERFQVRRKSYESNNKKYIQDIKSCGCIVCGEKDIACLDFHHLKDKEFNISNEIRNLSIENLKKEINKCIVLCSNCHRKLRYYNLSIDELRQLYSVPEAA